jgi:hypothetical protein
MIRRLKQALAILVLASLAQTAVMADTITGKFEYLNRSEGLIVVDGQRISVNMETTRISFEGENVGEEGLKAGDQVTLILGENKGLDGRPSLKHIILVNSRKPGLDS